MNSFNIEFVWSNDDSNDSNDSPTKKSIYFLRPIDQILQFIKNDFQKFIQFIDKVMTIYNKSHFK